MGERDSFRIITEETAFAILLAIFVIAWILYPPQAHAQTRLELGVGYAKGQTAPDGIWWESQYQTHNTVSGFTYQLGVSHEFSNRFGVRADYTDLLHFSTDNVAIPDEHAVAAVAAGTVSCGDGAQYCLARWQGEGKAYGFHAGAFYDYSASQWHFQPEAGLIAYRFSFSMQLSPLEAGAMSGFAPESSGTGAGTFVSPYARLTVLKDWFFARIDYNRNIKGHSKDGHDIDGIQEGPIVAVMAGVAWRFK